MFKYMILYRKNLASGFKANVSITVYWSGGVNGGFEQSFYIEICQDNGGDCREYGPFLDSPVKYQCGQIRDLQPGNVYLII
jgi:hypothetical protein